MRRNDERTGEAYDDSSRSPEDDNDPPITSTDDTDDTGDESGDEGGIDDRGQRAAQQLAARYGTEDALDTDQEDIPVTHPSPPMTGAPVVPTPDAEPPVPARPFVPQYHPTNLPEEERTQVRQKVVAALSTWDADQIADTLLATIDDLASRRTSAALENYMAAQIQTASDPIEQMAQTNLYRAAQTNPDILTNPSAIQAARYGAAIQYGLQTGDIAGAVDRVHSARRTPPAVPAKATPTGAPPTAVPSIPPQQAVPTGGGAPPVSSGGRRGRTTDQAVLKRALPFADDRDLEEAFGRR